MGYLPLAGQEAAERSANNEATHHVMQGLDLLSTLLANLDTRQRGLQLHLTLGPALRQGGRVDSKSGGVNIKIDLATHYAIAGLRLTF